MKKREKAIPVTLETFQTKDSYSELIHKILKDDRIAENIRIEYAIEYIEQTTA